MYVTLLIKSQLTNCIAMFNVVLVLFLSVSFINVAKAHDISTQEKYTYVADFSYTADNLNELDSGADDSVCHSNKVSQNIGDPLKALFANTKAIFCLGHVYLRPHPRAPPKKVFK
jgi:hypothetical protein